MSTIKDENDLPASGQENEACPESDAAGSDDVAPDDTPSEIALRLNLLGKLIIPPAPH